MTNILLCGISGKMGKTVLNLLENEKDAKAVCGVAASAPENADIPVYNSFDEVREKPDVIIDFSSPNALGGLLGYAVKNKIPCVLATTGYSEKQLREIENASKEIAIFKTANFSLGVNLLKKLVRETAFTLGENFDIEIIEKHHNKKIDAPSGTALMLAESANSAFEDKKQLLNGRQGKRGREIGLHSVRGGTIVGEHEVIFAGEDEIITLSHSARSKAVFAAGAIKAACFLQGKPAGMYDMEDMI